MASMATDFFCHELQWKVYRQWFRDASSQFISEFLTPTSWQNIFGELKVTESLAASPGLIVRPSSEVKCLVKYN